MNNDGLIHFRHSDGPDEFLPRSGNRVDMILEIILRRRQIRLIHGTSEVGGRIVFHSPLPSDNANDDGLHRLTVEGDNAQRQGFSGTLRTAGG